MRERDIVLAATMTSMFVAMFWVPVLIRPCADMSNQYETIRRNVLGPVEIGPQALLTLSR